MFANICSKDTKIKLFSIFLSIIFISDLCIQIIKENYPQFDEQVIPLIAQHRNSLLDFIFITIYQISGAEITGLIVATILIILIRRNYWTEAKSLAFATLGILITIDTILKPFFNRRRPPKPRLVHGLSRESFPSGHASGSLVLYFYLSFILCLRYPKQAKYIYGLATVIVLLIGFSSVYVNAHWATDIIAGYTFGYCWLMISLIYFQYLSSKKNKYKEENI